MHKLTLALYQALPCMQCNTICQPLAAQDIEYQFRTCTKYYFIEKYVLIANEAYFNILSAYGYIADFIVAVQIRYSAHQWVGA